MILKHWKKLFLRICRKTLPQAPREDVKSVVWIKYLIVTFQETKVFAHALFKPGTIYNIKKHSTL